MLVNDRQTMARSREPFCMSGMSREAVGVLAPEAPTSVPHHDADHDSARMHEAQTPGSGEGTTHLTDEDA
jgi:hypothetical protein